MWEDGEYFYYCEPSCASKKARPSSSVFSEPRSLIRKDLFTAKTNRGCERDVQGALGVIVDPREEVTFTLLAE